MPQQAAHAHHQQIFPRAQRSGNNFRQGRLAGRFHDQIRAPHQFVKSTTGGRALQLRRKLLRSRPILIGKSHQNRAICSAIERGGQDLADRARAQNARLLAAPEDIQASSNMRSIARRAFRAISAGTCTCGDIVSSERMTLSSVIVFMNAQTAFGFTG